MLEKSSGVGIISGKHTPHRVSALEVSTYGSQWSGSYFAEPNYIFLVKSPRGHEGCEGRETQAGVLSAL